MVSCLLLLSYLVDITTEQSRTYRMAFLAGLTTLAVPLANLLSVFIYNNGGYIAVWGTVLGIFVINILYVIFFVPETRGKRAKEQIVLAGPTNVVKPFPDQGEDGTLHKDAEANLTKELVAIGELARPKPSCSSVFKNLWKCFTVTFRPRAGYQRACVCLLLAGLCVNLFSGGETSFFTPSMRLFVISTFGFYLYSKSNDDLSLYEEEIRMGCPRFCPLHVRDGRFGGHRYKSLSIPRSREFMLD